MERFTDKIDGYRGLTSDEASERLGMYGYNGDSRTLETDGDFKALRVLFSFRFILTAAAAAVLLISGRIAEGFVLLLLGFIYAAAEIYKGLKCRDAFSELKRMAGVRFRVLRDGAIVLMRREYIVPDDIIVLQEGESVPADAHLLEAQSLSADESLFTGDRTPSFKRSGADTKNEIKQTCIYKGTRILSGDAIARVTATGIDTKKFREFGISADSKKETQIKTYLTGIEKAAGKSAPLFLAASGAFFLFYFVVTLLTRESAGFEELAVNSLLPAFAFALCLLPAESPRLIRAHYLYGAFSLRKRNCVVKDLNAMENLSAITALCVDKTGIITQSHTTLVDEYTTDPETLSKISVLSCDPADSSSFDRAIILNAALKSVDVKNLQNNELICRYPYSEDSKLGGNLWRINGSLLLCVKGSPENVLTKCEIQPDYLFSVQQKQQRYSEQGHGVVAVAYARIEEGRIPESVFDVNYTLVGLTAFENRTRDSAPAAVRSCYKAGVKVIMTTGDSEEAALVIGRKIGITEPLAMTGDVLRDCFEKGEKPDITNVNIFARVMPDQKSYIISLLRDMGEVVAVTGIGAADVEALEEANVGVALPQETSGAAKEVCGLVLADDDFNSVVDALKETRQLHFNIKQTIGLIITAVTATVAFALYLLFSGAEKTLSPAVISLPAVLLLPLLMLSFFGNRADIKGAMSASGFVGRGALDKRFILRAVTQGLCASVAVLIFQIVFNGLGSGALNSCFLAAFTGALIAAAGVNLSGAIPSYKVMTQRVNAAPFTMSVCLILTTLCIYIPVLNHALGLDAVSPLRLFGAFLLGIVSQAWVEVPKIRDGQK
ncbi:MAG: cation-translocating P-type ATPase [Oscillospiraceae bacterium]|nr:cation-translocating P-type ATPase [Oscillospiraceae bacterium]